MQYHNQFNNVIDQIFRRHDHKLAFSTKNNVINRIKRQTSRHKKGKHQDDKNISGIYQINCKKCDRKYIGKTERSVKVRIKEHSRSEASNVFRHNRELGHEIDYKNIHILHKSKDHRQLKILEKFENAKATKANEELLNIQTEIDQASNPMISRCCDLVYKRRE